MEAQVPMELKLLLAAVIIGIVQVMWAAMAGSGGNRDTAWLLGPRDDPRPVSGVAARLDRALKNFLETFPLFAVALLACVVAGKLGALTLYGSVLYVVGRALFAPVYAAGLPIVRTIVWVASLIGIIMVVVAFFR